MAIQTINNGEAGSVVRGKINDNFAECFVVGDSDFYPTKKSYQIEGILELGNGSAPLEIIHIGNYGTSETRNLVPAGVFRVGGNTVLFRNMEFDPINLKYITPYQQADAYGSSCFECGGEASILHATPAGVDFSDVPHEIFLASANGTDGESNHKITTGYFSQSKAPIFARFNSTAYNPTTTQNCWNQTSGADPLFWLSSGEVKNTINEFALLETNSATAGAWPGMYFAKSRGTLATKLTAADTDILGVIGFKGHDGTAYQITAGIKAVVSGAVSTGVVPTRLQFETSATNTAGKSVLLDLNNGNAIGFFGVTPVTRPVVATGSTTDALITALQNLGLISQS